MRLSILSIFLSIWLACAAVHGDKSAEVDTDSSAAEVVVLTDKNFEHLTQASTGATTGDWFCDFYATWCGHCSRLAPVWEQLAGTLHADGVNVAKIDVPQNSGLGKRFGVQAFPTLILLRHGQMYTYNGPRSLEALAEFARGGYKQTPGKAVPPPSQSFMSKLPTFEQLQSGIKEIVLDRKLPSAENLIAVTSAGAALFMLSIAIVVAIVLSPGSKATTGTTKHD